MEKLTERLTAKQQAFCEEYLIDLNATQAALRAGYSAKCINFQGPKNLVNPCIRNEIQRLKAERSARTNIKADDVVLELAKLAFSNIEDFAKIANKKVTFTEFKNLAREQLAAVESIGTTKGGKITLKLHSKLNALEQLGKHLGVYEADNSQKGEKNLIIVNFNQIDDTKQIIPE